jgi:hypothetical protein
MRGSDETGSRTASKKPVRYGWVIIGTLLSLVLSKESNRVPAPQKTPIWTARPTGVPIVNPASEMVRQRPLSMVRSQFKARDPRWKLSGYKRNMLERAQDTGRPATGPVQEDIFTF